MNQFARDLVHLMVDLWLDQFIEFADHDTFFIQFDGTDLYDFKRQLLHSILFAGVTLIPFQIQNDIFHTFLHILMSGSKAPDFDACGLLRATVLAVQYPIPLHASSGLPL